MKKIISLISAFAMVLSMLTVATAEEAAPKAFVKISNQTDTSVEVSLGIDVNGTGAMYCKSFMFNVSIPEGILDTTKDVFANKATSMAMFIGSNPANTAYKFNPNVVSEKVVAYGTIYGASNYDVNDYQLKYSGTCSDGMEIPADGIFATFTLPLAAPVATQTPVVITNATVNITDYVTDVIYGYGSSDVIGTVEKVLGTTNDVLAGSAPVVTKYAVTVVGGTADVAEAAEGDTVTVTPAIPEGKQIASVTGATVTEQADGTYTFTMPAEAVTITITYEDIPAPAVFSANAVAGDDMYFVPEDKEVKAENAKTVKTYDVTVANSVDGLVNISIGDNKTRDAVEVAEGEATTTFTMLIFNVPTGVTPNVVITD